MSNELSQLNNVTSMSSTEIAKLCEKRHDNVLRDIDNMFESLYPDETERNLCVLKFEDTSKTIQPNGGTRETRCFNLDKEHTLCLVTKYSDMVRMRVIRRWLELEAAQAPKTYIQALEALLASEKEKERLALENAEKAEFIDSHVHFPKYIRAEEYENGDYAPRKEIRDVFFPELGTIDRLTLVLSYYKCEKALYKNAKNMEIEVFKVLDIQDIRKRFEEDLYEVSSSKSGKSTIYRHPALPNMELRVKTF